MGSVDQVLYNLLYSRHHRHLLREGRYDAVGLPPGASHQLHTVELEELERVAHTICRELFRGDGGNGGLRTSFPKTLDLLQAHGLKPFDVVHGFVESPQFAKIQVVPYGPQGICTEEAFFQFMSRHSALALEPTLPWWLQHEFLTAMLSILLLHATPFFRLESPDIHANSAAYYAVVRYPGDVAGALAGRHVCPTTDSILFLYAASNDKLIRGPTTLLVQTLLEAGSAADIHSRLMDIARICGTSCADIIAASDKLLRLGLVTES